MKGNILVLTNNIGGLHSFRKEVVKTIVDAGYKVIISIPEDSPRSLFFKEIGCEIIVTRFNRRGINPLADLKLMIKYLNLMKQTKPEAVLTYTIKPNVYGGLIARLCHVPQLANVTGLGDALENGGWLQKLTITLYRIGLCKAKRIFFQNDSNRSFCIRKGIANADSILLPGSGVNLQHHTYQPYPNDDGIIRFLYIGRLLKDKGIEELFETANYIRTYYPNTEFQILGRKESYYYNQLDTLIKSGIIKHLGATSDVRPFIGAANCTIMPSYHEGMSNVNLESAANGRPVITTKVPGCKETVDDGKTGFLIEAKNSKSLMAAVERFIALPYNQKALMGQNGRKKMEKEFDRNVVVDAYMKELDMISNV